jgi:hypothetical protein
MKELEHGLNMVGICKGIKVEKRPNPNGGEYINESLGVAVTSPDGYGGTSENIEDIPLFGDNGNRIKNQVADLIGKPVAISFYETAQKGRNEPHNPYMRRGLHANSNLVAL